MILKILLKNEQKLLFIQEKWVSEVFKQYSFPDLKTVAWNTPLEYHMDMILLSVSKMKFLSTLKECVKM